MTYPDKNRFINNSLPTVQRANDNLLRGYEDLPLLTLEETVEKTIPLVPDVKAYVTIAREKCIRHSPLLAQQLTQDESAAIYLYTMPKKEFFGKLNNALRDPNRQVLEPWLNFLKLLITALKKLPSIKVKIWRAIKRDATLEFLPGEVYTYWYISSWSKNISIVKPFLGENGTLFSVETGNGRDISEFSAIPDEEEIILMPGTSVRARSPALDLGERIFIIDLEEINSLSVFEQIKQQYQQNSRIQRFMNPSRSFPIEQSYINLAIVKAKEQHEKENQLRDPRDAIGVLGAYEEIYGTKTAIHVKNIFEACKNHQKQVLVFGRAGIGKSTFCQYIAHQWAIGSLWPQYELLALFPLRRLTVHRYPPGKTYSLLDLVKNELFSLDLDEKEEELLKEKFDAKKTLWILDGYDEIVQNVPPHLQSLLEKLLKTPHHIITSRPYLNTLSYEVQMEITGFTDQNILKYVEQFFHQMKDELVGASIKSETLLNFLRSNSRIWGLAHIPVNLELICSLWSNEDWSNTQNPSMTRLYSEMIVWLCRRYLAAQNISIQRMSKKEVLRRCQKELSFLENLAFNAMESNTILIPPHLLDRAMDEVQVSSNDDPNLLNFGVLKSYDKQGIGDQTETGKDHYFIHLSFQEYFTARRLMNALGGSQNEKIIQFIRNHKYNQRYASVFNFAAGLLSETDATTENKIFWNCLLGEPLDLVGIRHIQLVISCLEETPPTSTIPLRTKFLSCIGDVIKHQIIMKNDAIIRHLLASLQRAQSLLYEQEIQNIFIELLRCNEIQTKVKVLSIISQLEILNPSTALMTALTTTLDDIDERVRSTACEALGKMGEKAAAGEVIGQLVTALGDRSEDVKTKACSALGKIGEKAATNELISQLARALGDENEDVRIIACFLLGNIGEKAATREVISQLVKGLGDQSKYVRSSASKALGKMGEKAATSEAISQLVRTLEDQSEYVRENACFVLGEMGEKVATNEVISQLVRALGDQSERVRTNACFVLGKMGDKAATNEVISQLATVLGDQSEVVRRNACFVLGKMGDKAATSEVIDQLVRALDDQSEYVRTGACFVLGEMGENPARSEVISQLATVLGDQSEVVRRNACFVLGKMGDKAATSEVIDQLVRALGDQSKVVRGSACFVLGEMIEKAVTSEVSSQLVSALDDQSEYVRTGACFVLGEMGENPARSEVIRQLTKVLGGQSKRMRTNACFVLGKMGEKAATSEVSSQLVSALDDQSEYVRKGACFVLGEMGEKPARSEVIRQLTKVLGDQSEDVRRNASEALGKMIEGPMNEAISELVRALRDQTEVVRRNACEALGNIGEKAATSEGIDQLVRALGDQSEVVRGSACLALGKMGGKAATSVVISQLARVLGDQNEHVRRNASEALGNMAEKAAKDEVISQLLWALEDQSEVVRGNVCEMLGKMGEKAATHEVISQLVRARGDQSEYVRRNVWSALVNMKEKVGISPEISELVGALGDQSEDARENACQALGNVGEKAAASEVINQLLSEIGDQRAYLRANACLALGKMGEKGATNEVVSQLVNALGDQSEVVRKYACDAVGNMGEKAATDEVISQLVRTRRDQSCNVSWSAREALVKLGEKVATNEVIGELVRTLEDQSEVVRLNACSVLGKMGEKAATNEVISRLVRTLADESHQVCLSACDVLVKLGEKAATNEVITQLARIIKDECWVSDIASNAVRNILSSSAVIVQLDPDIIASFSLSIHAPRCFRNISEDEIIKFCFDLNNREWLPAVAKIALLKGAAIIAIEDKIWIYGNKQAIELAVPKEDFSEKLSETLTDQRKRLHLQLDIT